MGCGSSKQKRCKYCRRPSSPVRRSLSVHVEHPAQHKGDSCHMVALTSSTLGSINLENGTLNSNGLESIKVMDRKLFVNGYDHNHKANRDMFEEAVGEKGKSDKKVKLQEKLMEAKVWSSMMQEKIPKVMPRTPTMTPPGEPETINAWELMEGLEDVSPLRSPGHFRSFSFEVLHSQPIVPLDMPKSRIQENGVRSPPKPIWLQVQENDQDSDSKIPEFDPEIISSFRKSCQELSPDHPFHIQPPASEKVATLTNGDLPNGVETKREVLANGDSSDNDSSNGFETKGEVLANGDLSDTEEEVKVADSVNLPVSYYKRPSFSKNKVILYFTSLRGVRKTYEDCCHVRVILKGLGVRVDERDMSMHSGFKDELKELLGEKFGGNRISLPRVFVGRRHIGGADEIRRLNEDGQLEKLFDGCELVEDNGGRYDCEACGDIRFVPCDTCSGSCKIYYECTEDEDNDREGAGDGERGFQRCPDCNENGLIRCPACCDNSFRRYALEK